MAAVPVATTGTVPEEQVSAISQPNAASASDEDGSHLGMHFCSLRPETQRLESRSAL